jgi:hypothetical protein
MMVEVFKTNITCAEKAKQLVEMIHQLFGNYKANFDLDDCDNILRIVYGKAERPAADFIQWLCSVGCEAELLPDI